MVEGYIGAQGLGSASGLGFTVQGLGSRGC